MNALLKKRTAPAQKGAHLGELITFPGVHIPSLEEQIAAYFSNLQEGRKIRVTFCGSFTPEDAELLIDMRYWGHVKFTEGSVATINAIYVSADDPVRVSLDAIDLIIGDQQAFSSLRKFGRLAKRLASIELVE